MSEPMFDLWKVTMRHPDVQLALRLAEALAEQSNLNRPWWRRRRATPFEFVIPASEAVRAALKEKNDEWAKEKNDE
jgi:hypothetical protein